MKPEDFYIWNDPLVSHITQKKTEAWNGYVPLPRSAALAMNPLG